MTERRQGKHPLRLVKGQTLKDLFGNNDNPPGVVFERCDWCGTEHRRWFLQRVCTNCVVAPRGAYASNVYHMWLWGLGCAACGLIGFFAGWVQK